MTANIQQEVNQIVDNKSQATRLDNLIQGYRLCARTEGKSENTIRIYTTALNTLKYYLKARQYGSPDMNALIFNVQPYRKRGPFSMTHFTPATGTLTRVPRLKKEP